MQETWTLDGLCADLNLTPAQIRRWIRRGALPSPDGCRKIPLYTRYHFESAKRIRNTLAGEDQPRTLADFRDERRKHTVTVEPRAPSA